MSFSKEQQEAIDFRGGNLLVSAAAGSGKTSVLVSRIVNRLIDEKDPVSIDSLVVVTFTRAAAEEMKTRLGIALENEIASNPENAYLIKQLSMLESAKITTIDSFCNHIVRNYYNTIGVDPAFRLADDAELTLVQNDVMEQLIEDKLSAGDSGFVDFIEAYAPGRDMDALYKLIINLYKTAQSKPWPQEWLEECAKIYEVDSEEEFSKLAPVSNSASYVKNSILEHIFSIQTLLEECESKGYEKYAKTLKEDAIVIKQCAEDPYTEYPFPRMATEKNADPEIKEKLKKCRNEYKSEIKEARTKFLLNSGKNFIEMKNCQGYINTLVALVKEFSWRYMKVKTEKNVYDFSDISHFALNILIKKDENGIVYTEVADELSQSYSEIYIDEYQDSNYLQEYILSAVSRERFGKPNTFMVGDVKQSIYKFRMAKPELFMDKYHSYKESGLYTKIELHKNYRSRENVLECVNDICFRAMKNSIGGVEYTDDVKLNHELADAPGVDDTTDIYVVDNKDSEFTNTELCAHIAANRILQLMDNNKELNYRDIVILLNTSKGIADVYNSVLENYGIPCIYEKKTGYFNSYEVSNVMDFLSVIDNPRQEIPLAGFMRSYFAYFTTEELTVIKTKRRKLQLYDCLLEYAEKEDVLATKCRACLGMIEDYRRVAGMCSIHELLTKIIYDTGYYDYIGFMKNSKNKKANLDMLITRAKAYESTSYSGLFNFLRYIEKINKFDIDLGEAQVASENDNLVRIMTIHKSKGLQFPVVILGNASDAFKEQDLKQDFLLDDVYGIAMPYVDLEQRTKSHIAYKDMFKIKMKNDIVGEELRKLYVALTRAEQKLIVIGADDVETATDRWDTYSRLGKLTDAYLRKNTDYLDIIMPSALAKDNSKGRYNVVYVDKEDIVGSAKKPIREVVVELQERVNKLEGVVIDDEKYSQIEKILGYQYPHSGVYSLRSKYSVSDLKHKSMEENEALEAKVIPPENTKPLPVFVKEHEETSGPVRGNAYHKVFELLEYDKATDAQSIRNMISGWIEEGIISKEMARLVKPADYEYFLKTDIGILMKKAYMDGLLFREKSFLMEISAREIDDTYPDDEKVLVQGIIDAFFYDNDKVYIVDYKTDRVSYADGESVLLGRYKKQLELYSEAIKIITGKEIGGCYIYSTSLRKQILV